jgi:hypothetical protein
MSKYTHPTEKWKEYKKDNEDIIEPFCGACLAIPLAFVGIGASAYGTNSRGSHKKKKKIMKISLIGGIFMTLLSAFLWWYFYMYKKCTECR